MSHDLRTDGSDRPVRVLIYNLDTEGATPNAPWPQPAYTYAARRWARLKFFTPRETTVGEIAQHEVPVTFQFHDQVSIGEDDLIVLGATVYRVTGILDPRTYVPGHLRSVQAVHADRASYTLSGP